MCNECCDAPPYPFMREALSWQECWLIMSYNLIYLWELLRPKGNSRNQSYMPPHPKDSPYQMIDPIEPHINLTSLPQFMSNSNGHSSSRTPHGIDWGICCNCISVSPFPPQSYFSCSLIRLVPKNICDRLKMATNSLTLFSQEIRSRFFPLETVVLWQLWSTDYNVRDTMTVYA